MGSRWFGLWLCLAAACADDEVGPDGMDGGPSLDASIDRMDATSPGDGGTSMEAGLCNRSEQRIPVRSALHVEGELMYDDLPPTSGNHNACWAKWAAYDEELPDERWVHNLEHGGVVFLYRCADGCPDEVQTMRTFVNGRTQALLTPYAALPTRFAAVAWGVRLTSDCFDMPAFERFYATNVDNGPESIPDDPPRSCR